MEMFLPPYREGVFTYQVKNLLTDQYTAETKVRTLNACSRFADRVRHTDQYLTYAEVGDTEFRVRYLDATFDRDSATFTVKFTSTIGRMTQFHDMIDDGNVPKIKFRYIVETVDEDGTTDESTSYIRLVHDLKIVGWKTPTAI